MRWRGRRGSRNIEDRRDFGRGRGDQDEALAAAVGDDRLQRQVRSYVTPDSFTHGASEQRARWFRRGFESGDAERCDSFTAEAL